MIGFHNVRFPEDISWGSSGGPEFKTQIFESFRGYEKRNVDWCQPLMQFNVAYGVKKDVQMLSLLNFFNARQGRAYGFRYKNWGNYRIRNAPIATGDGLNTRLPLWKFYGFSGSRQYKRLRKIVDNSVSGVGIGAVGGLTEGVDYNIDYETGEIALNNPPGYGVPVYGSLEFDEPVRFDVDSIQVVIDQFNSNSLSSLPLIGVKSGFQSGSIFAPDQDATGNDDFYDSVRLILNFDDTATPTATVDQSELAIPIVFNGDATLSTEDYKHGRGSLDLNDTGYLSMTGDPFTVTNLPFTIELFAQQPTTGADQQTLFAKWDEGGSNRCYTLRYVRATRQLQFVVSTDGVAETILLNYPWTTGQEGDFDYITIDRLPSGWFVLRVNGAVQQSAKSNVVINDAAVAATVGGLTTFASGQGPYQGLMDSVRVTIGRNRHPAFETVDLPAPYPV